MSDFEYLFAEEGKGGFQSQRPNEMGRGGFIEATMAVFPVPISRRRHFRRCAHWSVGIDVLPSENIFCWSCQDASFRVVSKDGRLQRPGLNSPSRRQPATLSVQREDHSLLEFVVLFAFHLLVSCVTINLACKYPPPWIDPVLHPFQYFILSSIASFPAR